MDILQFKLTIVGDRGSGKSSLLTQYTQNYFLEESDPELIDTYNKEIIQCETNRRLHIEIIDTIDFDTFHEDNTASNISNSDGFLVAFDVTSKNSYDTVISNFHLLEKMISKRQKANPRSLPPPVMLVGLKCDLESERQVSSSQALEAVEDFKLQGYFECSSKSSYNVEQLFSSMIDEIQAASTDRRKKSIISLHSGNARSDLIPPNNGETHPATLPLDNSLVDERHLDDKIQPEQSVEEVPVAPVRQVKAPVKREVTKSNESACCIIV